MVCKSSAQPHNLNGFPFLESESAISRTFQWNLIINRYFPLLTVLILISSGRDISGRDKNSNTM